MTPNKRVIDSFYPRQTSHNIAYYGAWPHMCVRTNKVVFKIETLIRVLF